MMTAVRLRVLTFKDVSRLMIIGVECVALALIKYGPDLWTRQDEATDLQLFTWALTTKMLPLRLIALVRTILLRILKSIRGSSAELRSACI